MLCCHLALYPPDSSVQVWFTVSCFSFLLRLQPSSFIQLQPIGDDVWLWWNWWNYYFCHTLSFWRNLLPKTSCYLDLSPLCVWVFRQRLVTSAASQVLDASWGWAESISTKWEVMWDYENAFMPGQPDVIQSVNEKHQNSIWTTVSNKCLHFT